MTLNTCQKCGRALGADGVCAKCLLDTGTITEGQTKAERLFQAALSHDEAERAAFVENAASRDSTLLAEVRMLLEGYAEAGGDAAMPTLGSGSARSQWATAKREEPGTVIDHFRLVRLIGEGGMGSVWEAEQSAPMKRRVALKIIKLGMDTEEVVRRFERERRTLALMTHSHIAQVFEAGATPLGRPYFAMELVEGEAITTHCQAAGLKVRERIALFLDVCAAVEHAHQRGVIHRDLKPSNILVAGGAVKVIDFGIAKATQDDGGDGFFTRQAQVLGTPAYMSPEQAESDGLDVDTRTDVYSLGVVLYELLSGALPFDPQRLGCTGVREMQRILREEQPPVPSTRLAHGRNPQQPVQRMELHGDLDWIIMKALRKERERRYSSAAAFADDLRRWLAGDVVSAVPPTLAYRFGKFVRRNRAAVAAVVAVVLALAAGLIVSLLQVKKTNEALAGEAHARAEATFTVADLYTRSGLAAAEDGDSTRAALWFANAAIIGEKDPARMATNRMRAESWRREAMTAVCAFDTGFPHIRYLLWNPRLPALIVMSEGGAEPMQIWNVDRGERWPPDREMLLAAWSPSGEWLAAVLPENVLAVVEYPSGKEIARFSGAGGGALTWSPDSRWIAAGNTLRDWRTDETRLLPVAASRLRFSRDGRLLLLQWASSAGVCDMEATPKFLHQPVASRPGDVVDFLGDGQRYVVSTTTGELRLHDTVSGAVLESYPAPNADPEGSRIVAVSTDGRFVARENLPVLDLERKSTLPFPLHKGLFKGMSFSPDGTRLATGGYDDRLELWSLPDGKFLGVVGHHHTAVVNVACSPDGRFIASGEDGLVRVWDTRLPQPVREISAGAATLTAVSKDSRLIAASGFTNGGVAVTRTRAHHLPNGDPAGPEIVPGGAIMDAVFSHDASWLALAVCTTPDRSFDAYARSGGSGNVQFWNPLTGQRIGDPLPLPSEPRGLCLHPSGEWLGLCCAGGEGLEIATASREARQLFKNRKINHAGNTLNNGRCAYSPDGRVFAVWGTHEFRHLWDRAAGRDLIEAYQDGSNAFDLAFHGDTAVLATMGQPMRLEFRSLRTGAETAPAIAYTNWPFRSQFSDDGTLLLSAGGGRTAQVWDWRAGRLVCPMLPHDDAIMAGTFVPGTPWVITGGHDGKIKFWDRRTGMMIRPPLLRSGWVLDLTLTPDARTLIATGFLGGNIELIDLPAALPDTTLSPEALKLRAEIDADAEVHPGGGLAPLTPQAWLAKWQAFIAKDPSMVR